VLQNITDALDEMESLMPTNPTAKPARSKRTSEGETADPPKPLGDEEAADFPSSFLEQIEEGADAADSDLESISEKEGDADMQSMNMNFLATERERVSQARTHLFEAAAAGNVQGIKTAISDGAPVNSHDPTMAQWTALHYASENGTIAAVKLLLQLGANESSQSQYGHTALHVACLEGHSELVPLLVEAGCDPDSKTHWDYTPFHIAASKGHLQAMRRLVEEGANTTAFTGDGNTALNLAATQGQSDMVQALVGLDIDVNHQNKRGCTALHHAAMRNEVGCIKVLLAAGANANLTSADGSTALHEAGMEGHIDSVETLVSNAEIDLNIYDTQGRSAFEAARVSGHGLCATVLWEKMGRPGGKLDVPPRPKSRQELDEEFARELWDTYCAHRNEPCLPGVKPCSDIKEWLKAKRRLNGEVDRVQNPEDDFVVRKGVRVYLKDKPGLRPALRDKDK